MRRGIFLAATVIAVVAGCGDSPADNPTPSTTLGTTTSPAPSPWATVLPAKEQAYLLKLEAIEPVITSNDLAALAVGYGICARIADSRPRREVIAYAQSLGSAVSVPGLSAEQGAQVVAAAKSELCQ